MRRRELLTCAVAGTLLSGCQFGPFDDSQDAGQDSAPWEERADRGIREHRTTELDVVVTDAADDPVSGVDVSVEMQAHQFGFGTAIDAEQLLERSEADDPYRSNLSDNFNMAVLENRHKWAPWESPSERRLADRATRWLRENGLSVRGHAAIWQTLDPLVLPADVLEIVSSDDPDRSEYLHDRTMGHVSEIVRYYDGDLGEWDVLNEHIDHHAITEAIASDHPPQEAPPLVGWFETAREASSDADLYYNDYNIIVGEDESRREKLERLVTYLQEFDAPIDGVGAQGHFPSRDDAVDAEELREVLDRLAALDVDLKITEYDTFGPGWTEEAEAQHLEVVLKTLFSHPAATGFLMWGFWDGDHWQDNAPLFREDWSQKPAYDVYTDLVFDEWWTQNAGTTDSNGRYQTRAVLGEYEIRATAGATTVTAEPLLTDHSEETVVLRLD